MAVRTPLNFAVIWAIDVIIRIPIYSYNAPAFTMTIGARYIVGVIFIVKEFVVFHVPFSFLPN